MDKETELELQPASLLDPALVLFLPLYKKDGPVISSDDGYGHIGTVIGATWRSQGRTFDGTDDNISCGNSSALSLTTLTITFWAYISDFTAYRTVLAKDGTWSGTATNYQVDIASTAGGKCIRFGFRGSDSTANIWTTITDAFPISQFGFVTISYDGVTNPVITLNGVILGGSWATGGIKTLATNTNNLVIGILPSDANPFKGIIGEVSIHNRVSSAGELLRNYEVTKWRFS